MSKTEIILKGLHSSKSKERRGAAKKIGNLKLTALKEELFNAFLKEQEDRRTWETQKEMIVALGILDCKKAKDNLREIIDRNLENDMLTMVAATAYIRITRRSLEDTEQVLELISFGNYAALSGVFAALAKDGMVPSEASIGLLLEHAKELHKRSDYVGKEHGLMDPRLYLAIACANWKKELTENFLSYCINNCNYIDRFGQSKSNKSLQKVCYDALEGKLSKQFLGTDKCL